jgi:hypothetical protein
MADCLHRLVQAVRMHHEWRSYVSIACLMYETSDVRKSARTCLIEDAFKSDQYGTGRLPVCTHGRCSVVTSVHLGSTH